jgi:hypothetical protein
VAIPVPARKNENSRLELNIGDDPSVGLWQIDWGDGTPIETVSGQTASHFYADGYLETSATIYGDGVAYGNVPIIIDNVAPELSVVGAQEVYHHELLSITDLGSFSDPGFGLTETWAYSINWGDGAVSGGTPTIDRPGSAGVETVGSFDGTHTYSAPGKYHVQVLISDDDGGSDWAELDVVVKNPLVSIAATDSNASESGPSPGEFTVSRTGPTDAALAVSYGISGSAINGTDYKSGGQPLMGWVTIAAGDSTAIIRIDPIIDYLVEGNETVVLSISDMPMYDLGSSATATVTITDNPPVVSIVATDASATEGPSNPGQFTVTRTGPVDQPTTISLAITGTAFNGTDYTTLVGSVTIAAGSSSATITVNATLEMMPEGAETVILTVNASPAYVVGTPASATVTITDGVTGGVLSINDVVVTEQMGVLWATFTVTRTGDTSGMASVGWYAGGGTATAGQDYVAAGTQTIQFSAGQSTRTIQVQINDDLVDEVDEWFFVTLVNAMNASIGDGQGQCLIHDND